MHISFWISNGQWIDMNGWTQAIIRPGLNTLVNIECTSHNQENVNITVFVTCTVSRVYLFVFVLFFKSLHTLIKGYSFMTPVFLVERLDNTQGRQPAQHEENIDMQDYSPCITVPLPSTDLGDVILKSGQHHHNYDQAKFKRPKLVRKPWKWSKI